MLLKNVIAQGVTVEQATQIQEAQKRWRLKFKKIESLQRLELYDQWCLQIHHCYCMLHFEHPPVSVCPAAERNVIDLAHVNCRTHP